MEARVMTFVVHCTPVKPLFHSRGKVLFYATLHLTLIRGRVNPDALSAGIYRDAEAMRLLWVYGRQRAASLRDWLLDQRKQAIDD